MEVPDDIFQHDVQSFPQADPKVLEKLQKEVEKAKKLQKAEEAEAKKALPKVTKAQAAAEPKPLPKELSASKREMKLHKIRLYFAKLSHRITLKEPKTYPKTDEAIDELLAQIEAELHSKGGIEKASSGYLSALAVTEQVTQVFNPLGWDLSGPQAGLASTAAKNKEMWEDLVTEFAIQHAEWFMVGPGKRLMLTTVQLIMLVDGANKAAKAQMQRMRAPPDLQAQAEGL